MRSLTLALILFLTVPVMAQDPVRIVPANQQYGKEAPWHIVFGASPTDSFLTCHHWNSSGGGSCPEQLAWSDFWFDAAHRRLWLRSLSLSEIDDPVDISLVRIPGTYPTSPNFNGSLGYAAAIGHIGFRAWRPSNGPSSYFSAIQGYQTDVSPSFGYGILAFATSPKLPGHTGGTFGAWRGDGGFSYAAGELIPHVGIMENGQVIIGWATDDTQRPNPNLLVMGRVEAQNVGGTALTSRTVEVVGTEATIYCSSDEVPTGGGGGCDNGGLRKSGLQDNGWQIVCQSPGRNKVFVICQKR